MKRQIKYRALSRTTRQWIYGKPYQSSLGNWLIHDHDNRMAHTIDPDTLSQYVTTLNDVDLYEGDKVIITDTGAEATIEYNQALCAWCLRIGSLLTISPLGIYIEYNKIKPTNPKTEK